MLNKLKYCRPTPILLILSGLACFGLYEAAIAQHTTAPKKNKELAQQLGWVESPHLRCGGYYLESAFLSGEETKESEKLIITGGGGSITNGMTLLQGQVKARYDSREVIANQAYLYRDPKTGKLIHIDLRGQLHLREPNTLILAETGQIDLKTKTNSLSDVTYRTTLYGNINSNKLNQAAQQQSVRTAINLYQPRQVSHLSAWGQAKNYAQTQPKIYHFDEVSYSTCPPTHGFWQVKASKIELNKETGRGTARNARLLIKGVPVFYSPYLNFPIDNRRKTGFLNPTLGSINRYNSYSGYYIGLPFYWNLAPNYDTTITPTFYSKRGFLLTDLFRYLTPSTYGKVQVSILPDDLYFPIFKEKQQLLYQNSTDPFKQAELFTLNNTHNTRTSLSWQNQTRFNEYWSADINYNYVSDDYFLEDFANNQNENAQNQLPQQGELNFTSDHWNFTARIQTYQTLHPVDVDPVFYNQYQRFPQLLLSGDYPDQWKGLGFFISNEVTHFDILSTPGDFTTKNPMGDRIHVQPGLELPLSWPYFYFTPRAQLALTEYEVGRVNNNVPKHQNRGLPIFDLSTGLFFDRDLHFFNHDYKQTLEPQFYYVYIPPRNQSQIPVFDTTVNTLNYDQLFAYNRFSGIDRINDANRVSLGITTRFIEQQAGTETLKAGIGEIIYFKNRSVTLCQNLSLLCNDYPDNVDNKRYLSPISGMLNYNMATHWSASASTIWDPQSRELANQIVTIHYKKDQDRVINLGFNYVRNNDLLGGIVANSNANIPGTANENILKLTDFSFGWKLLETWGVVGRWSEDWNSLHFQNLFYGLQYDSCCWAAQFVGGRAFTGIINNRPHYTTQYYFQLTLKGLGAFNPKGDPTAILRKNISGYDSRFGQDI